MDERQIDPRRLERWANRAGLVVCASVALPVLFSQLAGARAGFGPAWAFWLAYGLFVAALVLVEHPPASWVWLTPTRTVAVLAVSGWAAVLLSSDSGWSSILLVFTAAVAVWHLPVWASIVLIVVQTGVVIVAVTSTGVQPTTAALAAVVYAALQVFVTIAGWSEQRAAVVREELATANLELRAATALLSESSRARERLRIARDLHDVLGHQLSVLALELEVASHHATPPAAEHVARARCVARELLGDVRTAVGELRTRPPALDQALGELTADLARPRTHLAVEDDLDLPDEIVGSIIRCVQEIVTNTIRHADAHELWITVRRDAGDVVLRARDDGSGADTLTPGNGLTGLRERIEGLGGEVGFAGEQGFEVMARIPTRPAVTERTATAVPTAGRLDTPAQASPTSP